MGMPVDKPWDKALVSRVVGGNRDRGQRGVKMTRAKPVLGQSSGK